MPTIFSHVAVPLATGLGLGTQWVSKRLLAAGMVASILPDADVIAFKLGIAYASSFGHRGASHSIAFTLIVALLACACARPLCTTRLAAFLFVFISTLSHPLLDMLTNGGHGVALFWPFSDARIFSPWQVVEVSPLTLQRLLSQRGAAVALSELQWIWLPAVAVCGALIAARHGWARWVKGR